MVFALATVLREVRGLSSVACLRVPAFADAGAFAAVLDFGDADAVCLEDFVGFDLITRFVLGVFFITLESSVWSADFADYGISVANRKDLPTNDLRDTPVS